MKRLAFYGLPLAGLAAGALWFWLGTEPVRVERLVRDLRHPNPKVASEAWHELSGLYFTRWAAVFPLLAHAEDREPISFLVEASLEPVAGGRTQRRFRPNGRPWFYKAERIHCRSVGDAIRALLYNETTADGAPRWRSDYAGDWDAWWRANRGYYGI